MQPEIVCIGEPMLEFNQVRGERSYLPGHGGDTSNCAIAAARQGASVGYWTALGADDFGDSPASSMIVLSTVAASDFSVGNTPCPLLATASNT